MSELEKVVFRTEHIFQWCGMRFFSQDSSSQNIILYGIALAMVWNEWNQKFKFI